MLRVERCTDGVKKLESIVSTCCVSNWNGYGADPIPQNVISIVKKMLPFLNKDVEIFPTADQSIQLEVDIVGEGYFECVIQKDGSIEFFSDPASGSPLTDNQIEHLKALWAIGGQWLAKDASGTIFCYKAKPQKKDGCEWTTWESDEFIDITDFVTSVSGLVSWIDHEPYDIAKALGIKR